MEERNEKQQLIEQLKNKNYKNKKKLKEKKTKKLKKILKDTKNNFIFKKVFLSAFDHRTSVLISEEIKSLMRE